MSGKRSFAGGSIQSLSSAVAWVERRIVIVLTGAILLLILLNIATRAIGRPLVWVDELSVYLMVMTCFVGTSLTVRQRLDFAMTLFIDHLSDAARAKYRVVLSGVAVAYAMFIIWCCWRMFDPLSLWRVGFDLARFTELTANFIYAEPTQTLGIPKWTIYMVMPLYAFGLSVHALANLAEDLGWTHTPGLAGDEAVTVEAG
ncbi:MAG: TRAP transporter small permease [Pseudomonadota bacterium]